VYNHDKGITFRHGGAAANIDALYETPYLDFGDMGTRKTLQYAKISVTPDRESGGFSDPTLKVQYDFQDVNVQQPPIYQLPTIRAGSSFGTAFFNAAYFGSTDNPLIRQPIEGSCYTSNFKIASNDQEASYTINGIYINYVPAGRR
jgi:hypothetical protein